MSALVRGRAFRFPYPIRSCKFYPGFISYRYYVSMVEYKKDFDGWNERKKNLNYSQKEPYFSEGGVWWCVLGANIGFEQDGTGFDYQRPVLVLRKWSQNTCFIVPLTTSIKKHPFRVHIGNINDKESSAILSQAKTIDARRLVEKIAMVEKEKFIEIKKTIKDIL